MEKLINMESQLLFQIERKISQLPKQTNPLTKIQLESLINAIAKLEDERNLSKVGFQTDAENSPSHWITAFSFDWLVTVCLKPAQRLSV